MKSTDYKKREISSYRERVRRMKGNQAGYFKLDMSGEAVYQSFVPSDLPPQIEYDKQLMDALVWIGRIINDDATIRCFS